MDGLEEKGLVDSRIKDRVSWSIDGVDYAADISRKTCKLD
jgi:hypothetical protein